MNTPASPGSRRPQRPRLAVVLPSNPIERVYANSVRGVDGYAPPTLQSSSSTGPSHLHLSIKLMGYGSGTTFYAPPVHAAGYGMGTGLFTNQARKWERLWGLIGAGAGIRESSSSSSSSNRPAIATRSGDSRCHGDLDRMGYRKGTATRCQQHVGRIGSTNPRRLSCLLFMVAIRFSSSD